VENERESEGTVAARHHAATPGVKRRGREPVRRGAMIRSGYQYVKAYVPLFLAFVVLFGGVWAYISFGPHTPTAKDHWTEIENQWKPKRDVDVKQIGEAVNNFTAQQAAYKNLRDDTRSWMTALQGVKDWGDSKSTDIVNKQTNADVGQFVQAGLDEASILDQVVAATSASDVLLVGDQITGAENTFWVDHEVARNDIFGGPAPSALPSGSLSPSGSPGSSESPGTSTAPSAPAASPSPSPSPIPTPSAS
jgi:hypothetical protein